MKVLQSYVRGELVSGTGNTTQLLNPVTEEVLAQTSTAGIDMASMLAFAREHGGPALRHMTFVERGAMIEAASKAIFAHREELLDLAVANGGNTRGDAKFDVDGGIGTLAYYGKLGATLGNTKVLLDGNVEVLGKSPRFVGRHVYVPRQGVAVLINAFNFPAWGFLEKAGAAWLAGMPVVTKAATSTALVAARIVEILAQAKVLPKGALSFVSGAPGDMLEHLGCQDVVAFTGSSKTAAMLRTHPALVRGSVTLNVEADSLNAAVLGADLTNDSDAYALFLREVVRDITQKAGQKCTAIRRILVPSQRFKDVATDLKEALSQVKTGDPTLKEVSVGPLATAAQLRDVTAGAQALLKAGEALVGNGQRGTLTGINHERGYFLSPVLVAMPKGDVALVHEHEVFGPVASLLPYDGSATHAAQLIALGQGGLVASVYSDDTDFVRQSVMDLAPYHGRLHLGSSKMAEQSTGPGTVLPQLLHGGPGRAGGGEELGGTRALRLYMQRTAIQGFASTLDKLFEQGS